MIKVLWMVLLAATIASAIPTPSGAGFKSAMQAVSGDGK